MQREDVANEKSSRCLSGVSVAKNQSPDMRGLVLALCRGSVATRGEEHGYQALIQLDIRERKRNGAFACGISTVPFRAFRTRALLKCYCTEKGV